jgi:hypothetical protein
MSSWSDFYVKVKSEIKVEVKAEVKLEPKSKSVGVKLVQQGRDVNDPPWRDLSQKPSDEDTDDRMFIKLEHVEDKALFRFIRKLVEQMGEHIEIHHVFSYMLFREYCENRTSGKTKDIEIELHGFIDRVNFSMISVLSHIRRHCNPILYSITLTQILMNEKSLSEFVNLVAITWNDSLLDSTSMYTNMFVMNEADTVAQDKHWGFFRNLQSIPSPNVEFEKIETYKFQISDSMLNKSNDADSFIGFNRPYLFFVRVVLQSVHRHSVGDLKMVMDNLQVPESKLEKVVDATIIRMRDCVFTGSTEAGYDMALKLVSKGDSSSRVFLEWMKQRIDYIALFSQLVGFCTDHIQMASIKSNPRKAVMDRLRSSIDKSVVCVMKAYSST